MSALNKQEAKVRRLLDMVIEEVSLVDRPANQRRFLITKRSDDMSEKTKKNNSTEDTPPQGGDQATDEGSMPEDINAEAADKASEPENENPTEGKKVHETDPDPTAQALDQMADAVSTLSASDNKELLQNLGEKMRALADSLSPPEEEDPGNSKKATETSVKNQTAHNPSLVDKSDNLMVELHQTLASLDQKLEPLGDLMKSIEELKTDQKPKPTEPREVQNSAEDDQLQRLTKAMGSLAEVIKEQRQRVARMEKSFGLPNSQPVKEQNRESSEEFWPFDLNSPPSDRESIDRSVSFHDA